MHAFIPVPGGYACELEPAERRIIARVVADTCELLGHPLDDAAEPAAVADAAPQEDDDAVLAALAWEPGSTEPPRDPALARLLPPASTDETLAAEIRSLTESGLRSTKVDQLSLVHRALSGAAKHVVVREGEERAWLAALTDVRLVLASRLGIETDEDAERIYERAGQPPQTEADEFEAALRSLYAALTWWQESLLEAMSGRRP